MRAKALLAALGCWLCATLGRGQGEAAEMAFIAIEPNTGGSSGGHAALRIGRSVYHYMASSFDSLLLLYREQWEEFEARYCLLENRQLKVSEIEVSARDAARIEGRLKFLQVVQDKYVGRLEALGFEGEWLAALAGDGPAPQLNGIGFFANDDSGAGASHAAELRASIDRELGGGYLRAALDRVTGELRHGLAESGLPKLAPIKPDRLPAQAEIPGERLVERVMLREALLALVRARGLDGARLRIPDAIPLTASERVKMEALARGHRAAILRLLRSPRPDRGKPLMLATARCLAARRSLATDRMVLLDSVTGEVSTFDPELTPRHRELFELLLERTQNEWQTVRERVFGRGALGESDFTLLETAASRRAELLDAERTGDPVRIGSPQKQVPGIPGRVHLPSFRISKVALAGARQRSEASLRSYEAAVQSAYGFDLLQHNCGTELPQAIQSAFDDDAEVAAALGEALRSGRGLSVIPAVLSRRIDRRWNVSGTHTVPSRREREVVAQAGRSEPVLTRLRESNRLTSRAYPGSINDGAFLFFADGPVALRPAQGAANAGYGIVRMGVGVVTLPKDRGRRLGAAARGLFWSLPELVGVSIRKGQYDALPATREGEQAWADTAGESQARSQLPE